MPPAGGILSNDHRYHHASPPPTRHLRPRLWETIAPHLSGGPDKVGRPAGDNRRFINGAFWILRKPWVVWPVKSRSPQAGFRLATEYPGEHGGAVICRDADDELFGRIRRL